MRGEGCVVRGVVCGEGGGVWCVVRGEGCVWCVCGEGWGVTCVW